MSIYRCNQCGHLEEVSNNLRETFCTQCNNLVKVYDTVFFVGKLLERYLSAYRELQVLKAQETQEDSVNENHEQEEKDAQIQTENQKNLLAGVNLSSTDILATEEQHLPLQQWFMERKITPTFDHSNVDMTGYFDEASEEIGSKFHLTKDILSRIGWAYRNNHSGLNLDLSKMSQKDAQIINNLCRELYSNTLFSKYFYQKQDKVVRLGLQKAVAIKQFFSGEWLEWFALHKILVEAKQRGKTYTFSCARGMKIEFVNQDIYELDVVLLPSGKDPVVIECKSGEFRKDIEKYVKLKKRLTLSNQHFIILVTDLEDAQAVALGSMYELTFVTPKTLMKHVRELM